MKDLLVPVHKNGQSLIEVLFALGIAVVIIVALVSVTIGSLRNAQFAQNQVLATKYANEGMEKIRAYRDQNDWTIFTGGCNGYNAGSVPTPFTRNISCQQVGGDTNKRKVTVTVSWTDSAGPHQSELVSYFTKW